MSLTDCCGYVISENSEQKRQTMTRKLQRAGNNTISHATQVFANAGRVPPIPNGFPQDHDEFNEVWLGFTRARILEDWLPSDLMILGHVVKTEIDIRRLTKQRDDEGFVILNEKGSTQIEHPLNRVLDTLTRQQMARIRSLSLTAGAIGIAENRSAAKADIKAAGAKASMDDLLAQ